MKKLVFIIMALILIVPAQWAFAETPQKGGNLVLCVGDEPPGLDPTASASAAIDRVVYANIMEGLIKVDRSGRFVPGLATKWEVSPDGKVYTFSKRAKVHCLDAKTGDVVWSKDLVAELGVKIPTWAHAGSPLILGDAVVLNAGSSGVALNKADGSVIWMSGEGPGSYSTAVPFTMDADKCIVLCGFREIMGINPGTGNVLWRFPWKTRYDVNAADPIAKPLPIAAVVFPSESSPSVIFRTSGPRPDISEMPPALSATGP